MALNGDLLRRKRREKGLSIRYAADVMDIAFQTLLSMENNAHYPNVRTLEKVCKFYNLSAFDLIGF